LKLAKALQTTIDQINVEALLRDIHLFLVAHPPPIWKNRNDMPLRTVKTIVNEVVKLKG